MEAESLKWLASLGVGGVIAGFMFMYYRRDMLASFTRMTELNDQWKTMADRIVTVIIDETKLNSEMVTLLRALHRRLDIDGTLMEGGARRRDEGPPEGMRDRRASGSGRA